MIPPTVPQARMLAAIRKLTVEGVPPSYSELRDEMGFASNSAVHRMLHALKERGWIEFEHRRARSIRVVGSPQDFGLRPTSDLLVLRDQINTILKERGVSA